LHRCKHRTEKTESENIFALSKHAVCVTNFVSNPDVTLVVVVSGPEFDALAQFFQVNRSWRSRSIIEVGLLIAVDTC
jgi:hypothetical protein